MSTTNMIERNRQKEIELLGVDGGVQRKLLPIIYLLDTSISMKGSKISLVNSAMRELKKLLEEIAKSNDDAEIKVAVIHFDSEAEFVTNPKVLEKPEDFIWEEELVADGTTNIGKAITLVSKALSRSHGFLHSEAGYACPVIITMSDGQPTDNYEEALEQAMRNAWFRGATRIAIAVGEDASRKMLINITGSPDAVLECNDTSKLASLIKCVSATSSMLNSQTTFGDNPEKNAKEIVDETKREMKDEEFYNDSAIEDLPPEEPDATDSQIMDYDL